jgi:5-methylcytosine-specific restriction endonuclease McrA
MRRYRNAQRIRSYGDARRSAPFDAEAMAYVAIIDRDPCSYCGGSTETVDHIAAVALTRDSSWTNLNPACRKCNSRKSKRSLLMFLRGERIRSTLAA